MRRWFRRLGLVFFILVVLSWITLYGTSVYHRRKAARLLSELEALSPSTSAADTSNLLNRYRGEPNQECTPKSCTYYLVIENTGPLRILTWSTLWGDIGLRPWGVFATLTNTANIYSRADLFVYVGRRRDSEFERFEGMTTWSSAGASSTLSDHYLDVLRKIEQTRGVTNESELRVVKPCWTGGGEMLEVWTTSNPMRNSRHMAFDINFACTTAFKPCTELCQLMPSAWKQFIAEGAHGCNTGGEPLARARRACGDWAGRVGNAGKQTTGN